MASSINASTTAGLVNTADTSGVLQLQTAGVTAISIDASQAVSFTNAPTVTGGTANGVAYLNGSKVLTTGSALSFDGTNLGVGTAAPAARLGIPIPEYTASSTNGMIRFQNPDVAADSCFQTYYVTGAGSDVYIGSNSYTNTSGSFSRFSTSYASAAINIRRDGTIVFATNTAAGAAQTRITVNSAGGLQCVNTVGIGNATPSTSGAGITFPATQSASSDANTLDDYEEGTWTPLVQNASATESASAGANGTYVKVGKMVYVTINMYALNVSGITASAHLYIRGLPFEISYGNAQALFMVYPAVPVSTVDVSSTQLPLYIPNNANDYSQFSRNSWGGSRAPFTT